MKEVTYHYEDNQSVILLPGKLFGPLGNKNIRFVFDPGAFRTIISTDLIDSLGYGLNKESAQISTGSIAGTEKGYTITAHKLSILSFEFINIEIACFDLPEDYQIDGLLGLDLLEKFKVTLLHRERWVNFELL